MQYKFANCDAAQSREVHTLIGIALKVKMTIWCKSKHRGYGLPRIAAHHFCFAGTLLAPQQHTIASNEALLEQYATQHYRLPIELIGCCTVQDELICKMSFLLTAQGVYVPLA